VQFVEPEEIPEEENEFHLITKGIEYEDSGKSNVCHLRKLKIPMNGIGNFEMEEVNNFSHSSYFANIWLMKFTSNGRYLISASTGGNIFVWNLRSKELVAIITEHNHSELPTRDICIHPTKSQLVVCGEDSFVYVFEPGKLEFLKKLEPEKLEPEKLKKKGKKNEPIIFKN